MQQYLITRPKLRAEEPTLLQPSRLLSCPLARSSPTFPTSVPEEEATLPDYRTLAHNFIVFTLKYTNHQKFTVLTLALFIYRNNNCCWDSFVGPETGKCYVSGFSEFHVYATVSKYIVWLYLRYVWCCGLCCSLIKCYTLLNQLLRTPVSYCAEGIRVLGRECWMLRVDLNTLSTAATLC